MQSNLSVVIAEVRGGVAGVEDYTDILTSKSLALETSSWPECRLTGPRREYRLVDYNSKHCGVIKTHINSIIM